MILLYENWSVLLDKFQGRVARKMRIRKAERGRAGGILTQRRTTQRKAERITQNQNP